MTQERLTAAIIPAAGTGSRLGASMPKQFLPLAGIPILIHTVRTFLNHPAIHCLALAVPAAHHRDITAMLEQYLAEDLLSRIRYATGGQTRQDSVKAALAVLPDAIDIVLVHDGARPMISGELITRCIRGAAEHGAVIAAVEVKDTLKRVDDSGCIEHTVDRTSLYQAQTPQAALRKHLVQAFQCAEADNFIGTDEASLLEYAGIPVTIIPGSETNIKITRPGDIALAERLLQEAVPMKIGHGYDAHRLVTDRKLILGGVNIPFNRGLAGHSDADALTHALIDAILGALGEGDIGNHFPDSDPQFKDSNSLHLLAHVVALASGKNLRLGNADLTIICQQPRLAHYLPAMRVNLAECCGVQPDMINIKATTTEKMGFAGRGEGIAAHAVVLLREKYAD